MLIFQDLEASTQSARIRTVVNKMMTRFARCSSSGTWGATSHAHLLPGTPTHRRHLSALLSGSRLLLPWLARPRQHPRQRASWRPALAPVAVCLLSRVFLRDPRHHLSWQALIARAH